MNIYPLNNMGFCASLNICKKSDKFVPDSKVLAKIENEFAQRTKDIEGELILAEFDGFYKNPKLSYITPKHFDFLDVRAGHFRDKEIVLEDFEKILKIFLKRKPIIEKMFVVKDPKEVQNLLKESSSLLSEISSLRTVNIVGDCFNLRLLQLKQFLKK